MSLEIVYRLSPKRDFRASYQIDLPDQKIILIIWGHFFFKIGDEIPKEDTAKLLEELADKEDEDGFIPYVPFIDRLVGKA